MPLSPAVAAKLDSCLQRLDAMGDKFEYDREGSQWRIFKNGAKYGPPVESEKAAQDVVARLKKQSAKTDSDTKTDAGISERDRHNWITRQKEELAAIEARSKDARTGDKERAEELRRRISSTRAAR